MWRFAVADKGYSQCREKKRSSTKNKMRVLRWTSFKMKSFLLLVSEFTTPPNFKKSIIDKKRNENSLNISFATSRSDSSASFCARSLSRIFSSGVLFSSSNRLLSISSFLSCSFSLSFWAKKRFPPFLGSILGCSGSYKTTIAFKCVKRKYKQETNKTNTELFALTDRPEQIFTLCGQRSEIGHHTNQDNLKTKLWCARSCQVMKYGQLFHRSTFPYDKGPQILFNATLKNISNSKFSRPKPFVST